ncbi:hypothetical protein [Pseudoxanthomonas wuyuanensis]|uniref:Uncharacterized protein n=1 Tax=Pseudoxanthomonas wuyuanensis TaxID=1073196 RepID=A0A286D2H7_9GAMM|nr:hypothetical protein [Pseudoxanthomonas wuyuanensis]KAF1723110.1 hypothetical protein CSC75_01090 [Pseudoxanthomonas wuyuanensis]SOD52862.1 hypothetical protein SAMN06296416_102119 [Pseudoxanthomonas wuyuanensis]
MAGLLVLAGTLVAAPALAQDTIPVQDGLAAAETGTLVVDIKPFTSEKELPKKVARRLQSGALEWGIRDRQLVFTLVNKQFIDFPISHMTRYGQQETLSLPAGEYKVTGIGLDMTTSFSVEKVLERGAFVNEDVLVFRIEPGKTTTLSINPIIRRDATFAVNFWMPTLMTRAVTETEDMPESALNTRGPSSIAWPDYTGPLKFVAK